MVTLLDKSKVPFFDYFYLFCIVILAGQASGLVRGFGDIRTVGNSIYLALTLAFAIHKKVHLDSSFFKVLGVFALYSIFAIATTGSTTYFLYESSRWVIIMLTAYIVCKGYGYRFFIIAETVLYQLAVVALIGWVLLLIVPNQFTELLSHISLNGFNTDDGSDWSDYFKEYNIFIYTINGVNHIGEYGEYYSIPRNAGFAWEPGAFACFMCFAIFFNMMRVGLRWKNNKPLIVFLLALASTLSTTGYVTFAIMMIVWIGISKRLYWLLLLIPLILWAVNLPFISEKIFDETEEMESVSLMGLSKGAKVNRLASFALLWEEFLRHPIFGYGFSESQLMQIGVTTWSGIGKLLAQFGSIMTFLFGLMVYKSARTLNKRANFSAGIMLIIVMLGMMISYNVWNQPFFTAIWMNCLFMKDPQICYNGTQVGLSGGR